MFLLFLLLCAILIGMTGSILPIVFIFVMGAVIAFFPYIINIIGFVVVAFVELIKYLFTKEEKK